MNDLGKVLFSSQRSILFDNPGQRWWLFLVALPCVVLGVFFLNYEPHNWVSKGFGFLCLGFSVLFIVIPLAIVITKFDRFTFGYHENGVSQIGPGSTNISILFSELTYFSVFHRIEADYSVGQNALKSYAYTFVAGQVGNVQKISVVFPECDNELDAQLIASVSRYLNRDCTKPDSLEVTFRK